MIARAIGAASGALMVSALAACAGAPPEPPADLLILGGRVFTVEPDHAWAEAVAVRGDRIVKVGTEAEVRALKGPSTREYDATAASSCPGSTTPTPISSTALSASTRSI